jgi:hypothetical protein
MPGKQNKKQRLDEIVQLEHFIRERGGQILTPTNEWEKLRFKAKNTLGIVYTNKRGLKTFYGEAEQAYRAMIRNEPWEGTNKVKRITRNVVFSTLLSRDGNDCFYCCEDMKDESTIEHMLSISCGGNNHINNLVLACKRCNLTAKNMSVKEKCELRDKRNK